MTASIATNQTILVVGGGISGMTAALEAAECGKQVVLVERNPTLGGRTAMLYRYFPKLCHPTCGLEINLRRLKANRNLRVLTMAEVVGVAGRRGDYTRDARDRARATSTRTAPPAATARNAVAAEIAESVQLRPRPDQGARTCRTRWPIRSATCSIRRSSARPTATRRRRVQVRRDRSGDAGGDDRTRRPAR